MTVVAKRFRKICIKPENEPKVSGGGWKTGREDRQLSVTATVACIEELKEGLNHAAYPKSACCFYDAFFIQYDFVI